VAAALNLAESLCLQAGARSVRRATDPEDRALLWKGRKSAFAAVGRITPTYYVQDGVVPRSALPRVLAAIEALGRQYGLPVANVFHAGDGNLHPLILYRADEPDVAQRVQELGADILRLCIAAGGSMTVVVGVWLSRGRSYPTMESPESRRAMLEPPRGYLTLAWLGLVVNSLAIPLTLAMILVDPTWKTAHIAVGAGGVLPAAVVGIVASVALLRWRAWGQTPRPCSGASPCLPPPPKSARWSPAATRRGRKAFAPMATISESPSS
jgi:hypothetical protein